MIQPTPARMVWYRPGPTDPMPTIGTDPLAATVVGVLAGEPGHVDLVNLVVWDAEGHAHRRTSVFLAQAEIPDRVAPYAHWMPFQQGQAGKTDDVAERLEARVALLEGVAGLRLVPAADQIEVRVAALEALVAQIVAHPLVAVEPAEIAAAAASSALFVDPAAAPDGDGSAERPFDTLQRAVDAALADTPPATIVRTVPRYDPDTSSITELPPADSAPDYVVVDLADAPDSVAPSAQERTDEASGGEPEAALATGDVTIGNVTLYEAERPD